MFTIDLLNGQAVPLKSRPGSLVIIVISAAIPVAIALGMLSFYHRTTIAASAKEQEITKYQAEIEKLSGAVELQRALEIEKIAYNSYLSEVKSAIKRYTQWSPALTTLMDNIPDSIYFKDENNRFVMVNKAKASHANVSPEDMIGKTDFDFMPEDQARKSFEDDEELLKTGKFIVNKIEKLIGNDGMERWISVTKVPRFDEEGNIIGTVGISRDITEWKRLEEMQNKEQE